MLKENKKIICFLVLGLFLLGSVIVPSLNAIVISSSKKESEFQAVSKKFDLLIITYPKFKNYLEPLVKHKNSHGVNTKLKTLYDVYEYSYMGRDNPEKIKYYIKMAHDIWGVEYVMLVGDYKKMPIRYVKNSDMTYSYNEPEYISELYYADLYDECGDFQTWDSNDNGIFGEWDVVSGSRDTNIDLYPDVYVGRLACRNIFEVKIAVDKIIKYETGTYGSDWFNKFVVVAGDTYPEGQYPFNTSGYEGEENTVKAIENMSSFDIVRLWISNGKFKRPLDVIREFNKGCGLMFFEGHANPMLWGTHPYNSHEFQYGLRFYDMFRLINFYKLPVVVAGACHNGQFDITPLNLLKDFDKNIKHYTWGLECWAWKLASKPYGGSIATISNTGLGMTKEDKVSMQGAGDYMDIQFFYVYGNGESDILGECWGKAIDRYIDAYPVNWTISDESEYVYDHKYDLKTPQQWTLFGDPSLKIGGYDLE